MRTYILLSFLCLCAPLTYGSIRVAVTVDDLPSHGQLPPGVTREMIAKKMTSIFNKYKVPEVYAFINAGKIEQEGESAKVLQIWKDAGHPFGNHTYLHRDINISSKSEYARSIQLNEPMLMKMSPTFDWKYFRYPYLREGQTLELRNGIRSYLKGRGYKIAQVTIDFEDWSWNNPYARCTAKNDDKSIQWLSQTYLNNSTDMLDRAEVLSKSLFNRTIPHILLLHIGAFDAEMLEKLILAYKKKGVIFVPLSEAIQDEVYSIDPGIAAKWGSELPFQIMKSRGLSLKDVGLEKYVDYPESKLVQICL